MLHGGILFYWFGPKRLCVDKVYFSPRLFLFLNRRTFRPFLTMKYLSVLSLGLCAFSAEAARGARKNEVANEPELVLPKGTKVSTYVCFLILYRVSSITDQSFLSF
jgi:hypothetical protein